MIAAEERAQRGVRERVTLEKRGIASRGAKTVSGNVGSPERLLGDEEVRDGSRTCSRNASRERHDEQALGLHPFASWSPFGPPLVERDPRRHGDGRDGDVLDDLTAGSVEPVSAGETKSVEEGCGSGGFRCVAAALRRMASDDGNVVGEQGST
jgi:hypothetical protein